MQKSSIPLKWWTSLNEPSDKGFYLAIFRIYLSFHMLKKLVFIWPSSYFLFGEGRLMAASHPDGYTILSINADYLSNHIGLFLSFVVVLLILFGFGIGRFVTSWLLFLSWYIIQRLNPYILNGGDNYLILILMYMCFADSYTHLSLSKSSGFERNSINNFLTNLAIISIQVHLCLIYFISGISKVHSDLWYNGVAIYYILNLERFSATDYNLALSQNGFFVTLAGYTTMLWETFFFFLVSINKTKVPALVLGVVIHLSIYFFMMIHDFEILYIMVYGFFFTDEELKHFARNVVEGIRKVRASFESMHL